ncbi:hypothetical protein [Shewanella gaetbuli]|uniref:Uncharacterized protein n=1 Tax=Shewanella gaetbuli TaxID=220752 RepID=A0A9X2CME7_9GAMM|nr:hypothetical protein [Shewanella gaetbuli]MCL1143600.1 hypothetical protein [Shewanella gaetbuli]
MHKFDELLQVKNMQKSQLLVNTINLELHLSLKESLNKGDMQEISDTVDLLITNMSQHLEDQMSEVDLSPKQEERIKNALNGVILPCEQIEQAN